MERHFATSRPFQSLVSAIAKDTGTVRVTGPKGAYLSLVLDFLQAEGSAPSLVVTPTEREAESIVQDTDAFGSGRAALFPWWGTAPYEGGSPLASLFGERVRILSRL